MDEQQLQQLIVQLVLAAMQGDQQATQQIQQIMQAAQQGDPQAQQIALMILKVAEEMLGQLVQAARLGAKLQYLKKLRGQCPEGYEPQYYKSGGKICKKCAKKAQNGTEFPSESNAISDFRATRSAKCGSKMKKPRKAQLGIELPESTVYGRRPELNDYRKYSNLPLNNAYPGRYQGSITPIGLFGTQVFDGENAMTLYREPGNEAYFYDFPNGFAEVRPENERSYKIAKSNYNKVKTAAEKKDADKRRRGVR